MERVPWSPSESQAGDRPRPGVPGHAPFVTDEQTLVHDLDGYDDVAGVEDHSDGAVRASVESPEHCACGWPHGRASGSASYSTLIRVDPRRRAARISLRTLPKDDLTRAERPSRSMSLRTKSVWHNSDAS